MNKTLFYIILFYVSVIMPPKKVVAQKTDTIYHINGNILTGELKKLQYGVITWKMDGMGTINLDEIKVNTIISNKRFQITMKDDIIYFGNFMASKDHRTVYLVITNKEGVKEKKLVKIKDIVEFYPIKNNFWMRTSGNFSLGFNFNKGSNAATVAFSGNLDYRINKSYTSFNWSTNNTYEGDTLNSINSTLSLAYQHLIKKGWSYQTVIGGTQNSELGTKLRWELDFLGLKDVVYNSWNRLYAGIGLSAFREIPYGSNPIPQNDLAGIFEFVWKVYKITSPKVWVDANISFLPYLTENRYRANFNLNPKVKVFNDNFQAGFSLYYNYDSNPSEGAISTNDYGMNLNLSYSLH